MNNVKRVKVNKGYAREERELHINFSDGDDKIRVYTTIPTYKTKLKKVKAELVRCEYYIVSEKSEDGGVTNREVEVAWEYLIEPKQLSFRNAPKKEEDMTPEELEKKRIKSEVARERLMKARNNNGK